MAKNIFDKIVDLSFIKWTHSEVFIDAFDVDALSSSRFTQLVANFGLQVWTKLPIQYA